MGQQENIAVQKNMGQAINLGHFDELKMAFAKDVSDHDPAPGQAAGPDGFVEYFRTLRDAFPDLNVAVNHMVADEDNVAIAYILTGTHQGMFQGIAATGKKFCVRGVQIARFQRGKIVERWGSSDELGLMKQLGAVVQSGTIQKAS